MYQALSTQSDGDDDQIEAIVVANTPVGSEFAQICAPATLAGGYELAVAIDGHDWVALVPIEGVKEGELFRVEILCKITTTEAYTTEDLLTASDPHNIPIGRWRDGLFYCCTQGRGHALCCLTTWCHSLALGQVMHRMNVSLSGKQIPPGTGISPFNFMFALLVGLHILGQIIGLSAPPPVVGPDGSVSFDPSIHKWLFATHCVDFAVGIYWVYLAFKTRALIRRTYKIPESRVCFGWEDVCCSFWCTCCVISQMARHTVDHTKYHPSCCTETGVNDRVPSTLPNKKSCDMVEGSGQIV